MDPTQFKARIDQIFQDLERYSYYELLNLAAGSTPDDIRAVSGLALTADSLGFAEEARIAYAHWAELERQAGSGIPAPE